MNGNKAFSREQVIKRQLLSYASRLHIWELILVTKMAMFREFAKILRYCGNPIMSIFPQILSVEPNADFFTGNKTQSLSY